MKSSALLKYVFSLILIFLTWSLTSSGQYPFEKYPAIKYQERTGWKEKSTPGSEELTLSIPKFFNAKEALEIRLSSVTGKWDSSYLTLLRNGKQIQRLFEPMYFTPALTSLPVRLADINGDGLMDVKLIVPYMGTGVAAENVRVIYLFQRKDDGFTKISFLDKMGEKKAWENRPERDLDGDGTFEIITKSLVQYQGHSYWAFNLFNYKGNDLISANEQFNYPILIQFLYRNNYKITEKVSRKKMKDFSRKKPEEYDRR